MRAEGSPAPHGSPKIWAGGCSIGTVAVGAGNGIASAVDCAGVVGTKACCRRVQGANGRNGRRPAGICALACHARSSCPALFTMPSDFGDTVSADAFGDLAGTPLDRA